MNDTPPAEGEGFPIFETLYHRQHALARHISAPHAKEREQYLAFLASQGLRPETLMKIAAGLYWVARLIPLVPGKTVTIDQIKKGADAYAYAKVNNFRRRNREESRIFFTRQAKRWLAFMNCQCIPKPKPLRHEGVIADYCHWMKNERGLADRTIRNRCWWIREFLSWYEPRKHSLSNANVKDVDAFLTMSNQQRRWSRVTVATILGALRPFFRYAASRGLCKQYIAEGIQSPRLYRDRNVPKGPKHEDVIRLVNSMKTDKPADIRDRAMILLCAVYGLRGGEVTALRLEDIEWDQDQIHIVQSKSKAKKTFRLTPTVGNAIYRYLEAVRPRCPAREVFLTLRAPYQPLRAMGPVVSRHLKALGIEAPHKGPHALRHALACHLLSQNQSLKVIGDILGHRSCQSTRIYAKVDLESLRHVANLDLGDVL